MCLAVPGKVVKRDDDLKATVDMMGIERPVSLRLVPTAQVGDYILVHAGFGIQIVDEQEAQETLELAAFIHELRDKYGLTIFLIEHHMDLVMRISDYIYVIDFGSKIAEGIPQEIQNNQHVIDAYLGVVEDE